MLSRRRGDIKDEDDIEAIADLKVISPKNSRGKITLTFLGFVTVIGMLIIAANQSGFLPGDLIGQIHLSETTPPHIEVENLDQPKALPRPKTPPIIVATVEEPIVQSRKETAVPLIIPSKGPSLVDLEYEALEAIDELGKMKQSGIVMEFDRHAQERIKVAQSLLTKLLVEKYGAGPYYVAMHILFPESMRVDGATSEEEVIIELAPIDIVPYSVYFFIENIVNGFAGGNFHRNAGHVLQAMISGTGRSKSFAWQEYSPQYPHKKFTLGYAGRPSGGSAIYISTVDNTQNHGPASQGSKSEADRLCTYTI
jgi:hypothetical protein